MSLDRVPSQMALEARAGMTGCGPLFVLRAPSRASDVTDVADVTFSGDATCKV